MDLILRNADIRPARPGGRVETAVLVRGERIAAVGTDTDIEALARPGTRTVDLAGATLTPGFNDCHMHVLGYGLRLHGADVSPEAGAHSVPELVRRLQAWATRHPDAAWVRGSGYNQNVFPDAKHASRHDIDSGMNDRPVYVTHASGHAALANSRALALAMIDENTPDPPGGAIVCDESGRPSGILLEAAMGLVATKIPTPSQGEMTSAIESACDALLACGVTAASDMGFGGFGLEAEMAAYGAASRSRTAMRLTLCPEAAALWDASAAPPRQAFLRDNGFIGSEGQLRLGAAKLYADGALTTRSAALNVPFVDGSGVGMLLHDPIELAAYIRSAHEQGWQVATHAIGDRAIDLVLDCYESALDASPVSDRRHRIEHAMVLSAAATERCRARSIALVMQPEFLARLGDAYVLGLGADRAAAINPYRCVLDSGVALAFSSDCPVVPGRPVDGLRAAVARATGSGAVLGRGLSATIDEALRCYTAGSAYVVRDEGEVGAIVPGLRADLAILNARLDEDTLATIEVRATLAGGRLVWGELS